jgi:hypothetical protein
MFKFSRLLIAYLIAVPLALILGLLVTSPGPTSYSVVGLVLFFFTIPLILQFNHFLLIALWNASFNAFFLPGSPSIWIPLAGMSFGIACLNSIMFQKKFLRVPSLTIPLLFLGAVVLLTAFYRGGIGIRALGGASYGGRYYVFILVAIAGYFAFTSQGISFAKGQKMANWYWLSGMSNLLSTLTYAAGPSFYFLFYFLSTDFVMMQAASDAGLTDIDRISAMGPTSAAALCLLLTIYGFRGIFDMNKPWRVLLFVAIFVAGAFAGFRSSILLLFLICAFQFYYEGLMRTHYLPIMVFLMAAGFVPILFFSSSMPLAVQRTISFLPVKVDSEVLVDAKSSTEWRLQMWSVVIKELPKYLIIGKGYGIDPTEIFLVNEAKRFGVPVEDAEGFMLTGDYHSGPLSVIIPLGIFGTIAFLWVLIAGYRVLYANLRYGNPRLRRVNTLFMSFYAAKCVFFFLIFGALNGDVNIFLGVLGMSVSLNGGVCRRVVRAPKVIPLVQTGAVMEAG